MLSLPASVRAEAIQFQNARGVNNCRSAVPAHFHINVVFISHPEIEFNLKTPMNPVLTEESRFHKDTCRMNNPTNPAPKLKLVEFSLNMPEAKSVQLAADFTEWEAAPIDMIRFGDGVWSTTVPLPPGDYAYRFLVDGNWYDEPRVARSNSNSHNLQKALIKVK